MAVSMKDVRRLLDPDEPNYQAAAELGPEAVGLLRELVDGDDPMLASKAAYAAGMLEGDLGAEVVRAASHSSDVTVRVAAAATARNLPAAVAGAILDDLVADEDPGIRKVARRSAPG